MNKIMSRLQICNRLCPFFWTLDVVQCIQKQKAEQKTEDYYIKNIFVTITGQNHYLGMKPYKVGRIVKLVKDIDNEYDEDAIAVKLPYIDEIGYVANSTHTVFQGTYSASRLYDKIGDTALAEVMFITHSSVIARVLSKEEAREAKKKQAVSFDEVEDDKTDDAVTSADDCLAF